MNKAIIVLLSLAIATTVSGTACTANSLSTAFDFTLLGSSIDGSAFKFCKSLKAGQSCCDAATVNAFQTNADDLLKDLSDTVASRDKYLITARTAILGMSGQISSLQTTIKQVTDQLTKALGDSGASTITQFTAIITEAFAPLTEISTVLANFGNFRVNFTNYQTERGNCVKQLVNYQAAAWCLACLPDPTTQGYDSGTNTITYGDAITSKIEDACYNYLVLSQSQNAILPIYYAKDSISKVTEAFSKLASGGTLDLSNLPDLSDDEDIPTDDNELPVQMPSGCTSADDCDWLVDSLFNNGQIDKDLLAAGGIVGMSGGEGSEDSEGGESGGSRRLLIGGMRLLTGNGWAPADDEAGVSVTWNNNPGGVANVGAFRYGVMATVLAVFVALF